MIKVEIIVMKDVTKRHQKQLKADYCDKDES